MIGADALRKLLYCEEDEGALARRGYHYSCVTNHIGVVLVVVMLDSCSFFQGEKILHRLCMDY